jgi:radical SAM superfamily enzyme YgiQ (UPF0313 family)
VAYIEEDRICSPKGRPALHRSLYFINPRESAPGYHTFEFLREWRIVNAVNIADLTGPTVAALLPAGWDVRLCDERVQAVDLNTSASVVGITGKVSQRQRMIELSAEFRRRGKLVIIGGPHASLNPEDMRPHADILVRGEIEEIAATLFNDLSRDVWKNEYVGGRPDLKLSPVPRWDLYPRNIALTGQVQTSRGCPFECEFCDVIQYVGRKQRWKEPSQVISELETLYARGYRDVFFADDNLTVVRRRARELLSALAEWNRSRPAGRMRFSTQVSIDTARDPELLELCSRAGLGTVFIGIESANAESLAEVNKRQNLRIDLAAEVSKFVSAGIMVIGGMIVGFDHDGPDIFEIQSRFISELPVPLINISLLMAPFATPLYTRMHDEGRLIGDGNVMVGDLLVTNIRPARMTPEELRFGMRWLLNRIFSPKAFGERVEAFVRIFPQTQANRPLSFSKAEVAIAKRIASMGAEELQLIQLLERINRERPELHSRMTYVLLGYAQTRYALNVGGLWDPNLGRQEMPKAA